MNIPKGSGLGTSSILAGACVKAIYQMLGVELPENDMYPGFWKNPLTMQHPLSKIEIVAFDASYTFIFTKDFALPEKFKEFYPKAENLELLNCSL